MSVYDTQRWVDCELDINSCGCQIVSDRDYSVTRTRIDYTIMYLSSGTATVYIDSKPCRLKAGDVLLYLPGVLQRHIYLKKDDCVNKFVHFSGRLGSLLEGAPVRIVSVASRSEFESNFDRLIRAYCRIDKSRGLLCDGYLRTLIALILDGEQIAEAPKEAMQERIRMVINIMNTHINEPIDLDKCARMCYVSRERFNHMFKEQTGHPPLQYINSIRIERAKQLLCDSGLSVCECAETLGFSDINYFSRVFKKFAGVSPSKYRKKQF